MQKVFVLLKLDCVGSLTVQLLLFVRLQTS